MIEVERVGTAPHAVGAHVAGAPPHDAPDEIIMWIVARLLL
jgi:hypothetical protein